MLEAILPEAPPVRPPLVWLSSKIGYKIGGETVMSRPGRRLNSMLQHNNLTRFSQDAIIAMAGILSKKEWFNYEKDELVRGRRCRGVHRRCYPERLRG
jgi:hypothetical protein